MPTEKELISKLQALKEIKPRQEWVSLLKSEILNGAKSEMPVKANILDKVGTNFKLDPTGSLRNQISNFKFFFLQKKLAYSFATLLLIMAGMFGFAQYTVPGDLLFSVKKMTEQSQAALSGQTNLKQDMASLSNRINDLAQVEKEGRTANISSAIDEVKQSASKVAESLKGNLTKDPQSARELASEVQKIKQFQTLASLTNAPEIKDLNDALALLVQNEITDLEKTVLTEDQQAILTNIKDLYNKEEYAKALEEILIITNQ